MDLTFNSRMEEYYQRFIDLQEKLRKSEEERLKLEIKFNEMLQVAREEEQVHYRKLRSQYKRFLDEDRKRQERNEKIIRTLERIETRVNSVMSKTERIKLLRRQYQGYLNRLSLTAPIQKLGDKKFEQTSDRMPDPEQRKLQKSNEEKLELLDKYLESMQSWKTDNIGSLETERFQKNSGKDLQLLEEISEKLNRNFDSNKAHAIAEDIMNSIYSRHYKKDGDQEKNNPIKKYNEMYDSADDEDDVITKDDKKTGSVLEHLLNNKTNLTIKKPSVKSSLDRDNKYDTYEMPTLKTGDKVSEDYLEKERNFIPREFSYKDFTTGVQKSDVFLNSSDSLTNTKFEPSVNENINHKLSKQDKESFDGYAFSSAVPNHITSENWEMPKLSSVSNEYKFKTDDIKLDAKEVQKLKTNDNGMPALLGTYPTPPQQIPTSQNQKFSEAEPKVEEAVQQNNEYKHEQEVQQPVKINQFIEHDNGSQKFKNDLENEQVVKQNADNTQLAEQDNDTAQFVSTPEKLLDDREQSGHQINLNNKRFSESGQHVNKEKHEEETKELHEESPEKYGYQYDENDQPLSQFDENSQPIEQFNENDQPVLQHEDNERLKTKYDQPLTQFDENGYPVPNYNETNQYVPQYDENGQPITQYDENGQIIQQYDTDGQPTTQYDENGQLIQQYHPNEQLTTQYDENGQLIQQYDVNSQPTTQYDENGQLIQQYDANGQPTTQYDENGQIIQPYDVNGQITIQYDENGQPIQQYDENGHLVMQYEAQYDENGQLIQQQYDEQGQPIQNYQQYDENGQPIPYDQQYDENGQPIQTYNENNQIYHNYDQPVLQFDENGQPIQTDYEAYQPELQTGHGEHFGETVDAEHSENTVREEENINKDPPGDNKKNVLDILDTDTESARQNTSKISNDSDFDFSNG